MVKINLLPWREEYRQEKKKEFVSQLVVVAVLGALAALAWIASMNNRIDSQNNRNVMLNQEIKALDKRVQEIQELKERREELIARMKVIQDLQGTRPTIVRYFDEFVRALPKGVHVDSVNRIGEVLSIEGIADSNQRVSRFMRNLNDSNWFADPDLKSITSSPEFGEQAVKFSLILKTVLPKSADDEDEGTAAAARPSSNSDEIKERA